MLLGLRAGTRSCFIDMPLSWRKRGWASLTIQAPLAPGTRDTLPHRATESDFLLFFLVGYEKRRMTVVTGWSTQNEHSVWGLWLRQEGGFEGHRWKWLNSVQPECTVYPCSHKHSHQPPQPGKGQAPPSQSLSCSRMQLDGSSSSVVLEIREERARVNSGASLGVTQLLSQGNHLSLPISVWTNNDTIWKDSVYFHGN